MTSPGGKKNLAGLHLGLQFALCSLGGMAFGYWLGQRWSQAALGLIAGLFAGSVLGMYFLARETR